MEKLGTFIHGIGSSEALDSSGERLKISGIDDSSMEVDGKFNWEHESKQTSQIVGQILISKKILKASDCVNKHHKHFYELVGKKPYLYICGVLFDEFGHNGAVDLAAMYKFNDVVSNKNMKTTVGFSIEGSKLEKEGDTITRCIARKMTCTVTPCNKECISELVTDEDYINDLTEANTKDKLHDIFLKSEGMEMDLQKADDGKPKLKDTINRVNQNINNKPKASKLYMNIPKQTALGTTGQGVKVVKPGSTLIKPKGKVFSSNDEASKQMKVGDKLLHDQKAKTGRSGASIYNDPNTWKTENKKYGAVLAKKRGVPKGVDPAKHEKCVKDVKSKGKDKSSAFAICNSSMDKAMTAGGMGGVPSTATGGSALQKEKKLVKKSEKLLSKVLCKSESYWNNYKKQDALVEFISIKMPKLNKKEVLAIAKTTVYKMETEREHLLEGLCD